MSGDDELAMDKPSVEALAQHIVKFKPHLVVELGAGKGITAEALAVYVPLGGRYLLVEPDPECYWAARERVRTVPEMLVCTVIPMNESALMDSWQPHAKPDLVIVDCCGDEPSRGEHARMAWQKLVAPSGHLALHDSNSHGYASLVSELEVAAVQTEKVDMGRGLAIFTKGNA